MNVTLALLVAVVFLAFTVEASLGFGATVVTVALGSMLLPLESVLPAFVPLNIVLSAYIALRYWRHVDLRLLARRVAPAMLAGIPVGLFAFQKLPESALKRVFAAFVLVLAALELARLARERGRAGDERARPLGRVRASALLFLGGVVHGAFATGGPLAVYVAGREIGDDKARFRATLGALWLVLNGVLIASYVLMGRLNANTARTTVWLAAPLAAGMLAGEAVHARVPMRAFKVMVWGMLAVAGTVLLLRG